MVVRREVSMMQTVQSGEDLDLPIDVGLSERGGSVATRVETKAPTVISTSSSKWTHAGQGGTSPDYL